MESRYEVRHASAWAQLDRDDFSLIITHIYRIKAWLSGINTIHQERYYRQSISSKDQWFYQHEYGASNGTSTQQNNNKTETRSSKATTSRSQRISKANTCLRSNIISTPPVKKTAPCTDACVYEEYTARFFSTAYGSAHSAISASPASFSLYSSNVS